MNFTVLPTRSYAPSTRASHVYLIKDDWNDWFKFRTMFYVVYTDEENKNHDIGHVKIAKFGMESGGVEIPTNFEKLDDTFFSVGQDDSYYLNLNKLGSTIRDEILSSLNDIAKSETIYDKAIDEEVTKESLLRDISISSVIGQFRRIANGGSRLTEYEFKYILPKLDDSQERTILSFHVEPESNPPTNIHVLIGRNGVGKTQMLTRMRDSFFSQEENAVSSIYGGFEFNIANNEYADGSFSNLVFVTFSAFDGSNPYPNKTNKNINYAYVGLKQEASDEGTNRPPKDLQTLSNEFSESLSKCRIGAKKYRLNNALQILEADPLFKEYNISDIQNAAEAVYKSKAREIFSKLSSGHKIVLLTISRLVETVEEKTLVLMDEPETHLHPPLLSAFIRALSDLLIDRNGVAIIATHSPVVLQEVPKSCVLMLRRSGNHTVSERLDIESFGESVGILTYKVFGLEVTQSGFHSLLLDAVRKYNNYDRIVRSFDNEIGQEAKAIIRGLLANNSEQQ